MAPRPFLTWPDPRLSTAAEPVEAITEEIQAIWTDMIDTMDSMPGLGVGLAAPQIGVMLRLAVVDASQEPGMAVRLANPVVLEASDDLHPYTEASPNLPGLSAEIRRPAEVRVGYLDETGAETSRSFRGLWATSVQHQIDHLNGRMYFDNLSRTKRAMLMKKARKAGMG